MKLSLFNFGNYVVLIWGKRREMSHVQQNRMAFTRATNSFGLSTSSRPTLSNLQSLVPSSYQRQALRPALTSPDNASYWDLNRLISPGQHRANVTRGEEEWVLEKDPETGMIVRTRFQRPSEQELFQLALTLGLLPINQPDEQSILSGLAPLVETPPEETPNAAHQASDRGLDSSQ